MSLTRSGTVADAETPPTGSRRAVTVVVGVVFLDLLGFGVVIPILPFYVRSFGVSDVFIGLLAASYSLAQFLAAPTLGRVSDRYGRRPVIMASVAAAAVAWAVFGLAAEVGNLAGTAAAVVTLFASRLLAGAAGGNIAAAQAYVADVTPDERRAGALGLVGAAFALGFVFGPAIGGLAASDAVVAAADGALPGFVPTTRFSLPSFTAAGLSLLAFVAAALVLEEPDGVAGGRRTADGRPAGRTSLVGQFRAALADGTLRPLVLAFFLASVAFAGIQVMFIPFAADFYGYGATEAALFLTYIGVLGTVNQGVLVGRLERRFGAAPLAVAGGVSLATALALLPFTPQVGGLLPSPGGPAWLDGPLLALLADGALLSFGNGALTVSLTTLVSRGASRETQGAAFGVTQGAGSLGRTVGPPLAAAAYVAAYWSPFVAGAAVLLPALWLLRR
ncbi:MFS transporter [Halorarum salinum]|uniref:MFS transporter n=1 Tax=Halorarum salinum TaxID=2743089 RepID=A0A7D5QIW5_9EURY|nr:MFS transporter [Halobaculum salinum]QLG60985.1 MFS transporter [Halobaculum salinum]